ncbi:hypothetical protein RBU49_04925 [Clostridium sp. MB40-C1]|uniref:site-2 protease family protein n=1 Tax=Clostridium sp. MB40-C1 TaxID=3070996 RepID=UPI0027E037FA|nr:site-2 protease family protein [Clostridium sp. MB40-C1]WMJ81593.1 hypothetical protein RBU49_04925 [Clostridium sp. MB40-C1]
MCFKGIACVFINILSFEVEDVTIFIGPKLFSGTIGITKFNLKAIPCGSYIKLKDTFIDEASRFEKLLIIYFPTILLLIVAFYVVITSQSYVYTMSSKLLILVNGPSVLFSIISNNCDVF